MTNKPVKKYGWKYFKEKRKREIEEKNRKDIKKGLIVLLVIIAILAWSSVETVSNPTQPIKTPVKPKFEATRSVKGILTDPLTLIYQYADDPQLVERIATCESQLGKFRTNWKRSGAVGLLQFKPETFNFYCSGDIQSDTDQIKCFNKLYPQHKNWWKCS